MAEYNFNNLASFPDFGRIMSKAAANEITVDLNGEQNSDGSWNIIVETSEELTSGQQAALTTIVNDSVGKEAPTRIDYFRKIYVWAQAQGGAKVIEVTDCLNKHPVIMAALDGANWALAKWELGRALAAGDLTQDTYDKALSDLPDWD